MMSAFNLRTLMTLIQNQPRPGPEPTTIQPDSPLPKNSVPHHAPGSGESPEIQENPDE